MKFLLMNLYTECGLGLRSVGAALLAEGHEIHFFHINEAKNHFAHAGDQQAVQRVMERDPFAVRRVQPDGDLFICVEGPLTESEIAIMLEHVACVAPEAIGMSLHIGSHPVAAQITQAIKKHTSVPIIWGGVYPSIFPEKSLQHCDIVCQGEGEMPMVEWAKSPGNRSTPGLWFRDGENVIQNDPGECLELDDLPAPLCKHNEMTLLDNQLSRRMEDPEIAGFSHVFLASRYCRFKCSYCLSGQMRRLSSSKKPRRKSVDRFIQEILDASQKYKLPARLDFWDDNFDEDADWLAEFLDKYPRKVGIPFSFNTHPAISKAENIEALINAGATLIGFGLQSGSERVLKEVYHRPAAFDNLITLMQRAIDCEVPELVVDSLTNSPFDTEEDCYETLETLIRLPKPYELHISKLVIYPGSRLASYDGPRGKLTDEDFDFWNLIYLLSQVETLAGDDLRLMAGDPHLRKNPETLRHIVKAMLDAHHQSLKIQQLEKESKKLQCDIARRDFMLEHSCHKKLHSILMDKVRYRLQRWRNPDFTLNEY